MSQFIFGPAAGQIKEMEGATSSANGTSGLVPAPQAGDEAKYLKGDGTFGTVDLSSKLDASLKGSANGVAELDANGKVPSAQLPSYVDDVEEYASLTNFPATGESGKIYIAKDTNITYRWGGSSYVAIGSDLALGETSSTAYRGDRGKTAYDHATDSSRITTAQTSGLYKIAVTTEGHVASVTAAAKSDITALGIPGDISGKVDIAQGAANEGKILKVNSSGNLELAESSGTAFVEYTVSILSTDWSSTSPYTYTWQSNGVTSNTLFDIYYPSNVRSVLNSDIDCTKVTGGLQFTVTEKPTATLTLIVRLINNTSALVISDATTTASGLMSSADKVKLNGKMDNPTNTGAQGQILQNDGNGGAEWTSVGTPSDAQVGTAVSAWLTAHPEATTTVQDGAISRAKLDADLKEKTDAVPDLKSAINTGREKENVNITWGGGYVNLNGIIVASQYSGFALVTMHKNETVKIGTANSNITMVGTTTANSVAVGDTITPIYKTSSAGTWEEYTFTAPSDINIVLCVTLSDYSVEFTDDVGIIKYVKQNFISKDDIDLIDISESKNLFDPYAITTGYAVNNSGEHENTEYYAVSDYIPVSAGDVIRATPFSDNAESTFALYDSEKTWKTGTRWIQTAYDGYLEITIPSGIAYVTVNLRGADSNKIVVVKNTAFNASYAGTYGKTIGIDGGMYQGILYGKKIAYNGDSICESRIIGGTGNNGGAYAHLIAQETGCKYENRAISGGILASAPGDGGSTPSRCVVSDVTNMASDADLICFEGGINDYWREVPLGDYSESDYSSTVDTTTVCGALESIFRQATQKWVGKPIVFIIVHKIKSTVYIANSAGYTFAQEREKMIGICNKYAIPYYDAFAESGLNAYNDVQNTNFLTSNSTGNPDGCHPNEAGYRRYYVPQLIKLFESLMPRLEE